jgi:hypothetical protein
MGRPTPETGGGASQNQGLSEFKPLSKEKGVGWGVKKPEEPKQQPSDPNREAFERFFRRGPMRPAVFEGIPPRRQIVEGNQPTPQKPGEQRGAPEASKPNPVEQQTPQRRRTQRERARLAQDTELRSLADELWGKVLTKGRLTEVISESLYRYPDLPPDEALREYRDDYQGFSFA